MGAGKRQACTRPLDGRNWAFRRGAHDGALGLVTAGLCPHAPPDVHRCGRAGDTMLLYTDNWGGGSADGKSPYLLMNIGGPPGDRTQDSLIKSQVLYH